MKYMRWTQGSEASVAASSFSSEPYSDRMLNETRSPQWSDDELDALIDSYLGMLKLEVAGETYNKRQNNLKLQEFVKRSHAAIEFKLCNVSAVLDGLGRRYIFGYKPRPHFQAALRERLLRRLGEFPLAEGCDWSSIRRSPKPPRVTIQLQMQP